MSRARPLTDKPDRSLESVPCCEGEHEECPGHHWAMDGGGKAIPATDPITNKVIPCTCGCHMGGRPWPFEAEGYVPPERDW